MKIKPYLLMLALGIVACGDEDAGRRTFSFLVFDGEAPAVNGISPPAGGAQIKVFTSAQAWLDGDPPLKSFTVNDKGKIETFNRFDTGNIVYADNGTYNNWPQFLLQENLFEDVNHPEITAGSAIIYNSFLSLFMSVENKSFLLSDVRLNGSSIFESVSSCSKDNTLKLMLNATLLYSEGASICEDRPASQQYSLNVPFSTAFASETVINAISFYQFTTAWAEVENNVYIRKDFSQVWFRINDGNEMITIYTKQD